MMVVRPGDSGDTGPSVIHDTVVSASENSIVSSCDLVCKENLSAISAKETTNTSFFEGVEKNLEVWFTNSNEDIKNSDLRNIPRCAFISV